MLGCPRQGQRGEHHTMQGCWDRSNHLKHQNVQEAQILQSFGKAVVFLGTKPCAAQPHVEAPEAITSRLGTSMLLSCSGLMLCAARRHMVSFSKYQKTLAGLPLHALVPSASPDQAISTHNHNHKTQIHRAHPRRSKAHTPLLRSQ